MQENDLIEKAKKRVEDKKGFHIHVVSFISVMLFLAGLNYMLTPGFLWFLIVLGGWGIGLVIHYFTVYGFFGLKGPDWEEKELQNEISKLRELEDYPIDDEETLDLDDRLDLKEKIKVRKDYDDEELV
jgi:hypothetical protein